MSKNNDKCVFQSTVQSRVRNLPTKQQVLLKSFEAKCTLCTHDHGHTQRIGLDQAKVNGSVRICK